MAAYGEGVYGEGTYGYGTGGGTGISQTAFRDNLLTSNTRRVIAVRALTGEVVSWDVTLSGATHTRELSGPGGIKGQINHRDLALIGSDGLPVLREWSTALFYEADGQIRGGGLIVSIEENDQGQLIVEAPGYSTYPHGIPYTGLYRPGLGADPLDVLREIWRHVQSFPDADLGVTVGDATSKGKIDDTSANKPVAYVLPWWDSRDCGSEIDSMLDAAPADYIEVHAWDATRENITHEIRLGSPRLGKKRTDLRFVEGENIVAAVPLKIDGDEFAQTIVGLGKGEGRKMVRSTVATRDDRIRRVAVVADKSANAAKMQTLAQREHDRRADVRGFETVVVRDHPNARLSDIAPGDDVLIQATLLWYGRTQIWSRVLSIEEALEGSDQAVLTLARSDQFLY